VPACVGAQLLKGTGFCAETLSRVRLQEGTSSTRCGSISDSRGDSVCGRSLRLERFCDTPANAQVGEKDGGKLELLKVLSAHTQVLPASASGAYAAAAGTG